MTPWGKRSCWNTFFSNNSFTIAHTVSRSPSGRCFPSSRYSAVSDDLPRQRQHPARRPAHVGTQVLHLPQHRAPAREGDRHQRQQAMVLVPSPARAARSTTFSLQGMPTRLDARSPLRLLRQHDRISPRPRANGAVFEVALQGVGLPSSAPALLLREMICGTRSEVADVDQEFGSATAQSAPEPERRSGRPDYSAIKESIMPPPEAATNQTCV